MKERRITFRVFVRQLRKKLKDDSTDPRWIGTEPGIGYRWLAESGLRDSSCGSRCAPLQSQ